ncbi:hypothetical protein BC835DRAFT_1338119 [Cytidiella melzeri]|nr:hypothetical protein BC835DRAFT_1338119 [Cytidiella melzeri]
MDMDIEHSRLLHLTRPELVALSIFLSYFLLIIFLFVLIAYSLWRNSGGLNGHQRTAVRVFSSLAASSFGFTWYYMIGFLLWSFRTFESSHYTATSQYELDGLSRLTTWLVHSDLFEQAWSIVCTGHMNWWWSEKLCLFTVGYWTIFLATEGRTRSIPHLWAYMLLGQVVAISVAANLCHVAISLSPAPQLKPTTSPPLILWLSVCASLVTVVFSPYTTEGTFLPNLLIMHFFIVLPLIFPLKTSGKSYATSTIYAAVALFSIALHTWTTGRALLALPQHMRSLAGFAQFAVEIFYSHPAQSSISWDVVWTFISLSAWLYLSPVDKSTNVSDAKWAGKKEE